MFTQKSTNVYGVVISARLGLRYIILKNAGRLKRNSYHRGSIKTSHVIQYQVC